MLKLWEWGTGVFAFQAVVGSIVYYRTGDIASVALGALGAALAAATVALAAASVALAATLAIMSAAATLAIMSAVFAALAAMSAALAAFAAKKDGARENVFCLFIAALPLGVGTVFGGMILFYLYLQKKVAAA